MGEVEARQDVSAERSLSWQRVDCDCRRSITALHRQSSVDSPSWSAWLQHCYSSLTQGGIWKVKRHFCPAGSSGMSGVTSVSQRPPHRLQGHQDMNRQEC